MADLTTKQQAFVAHYLICWNASEAARRAGYTGQANVVGPRLLANVSIQAAIQERLTELHASADEVLTRITDQARASLEDFVDVAAPSTDLSGADDVQDAKAIASGWRLNLVKAQQLGKLHLLKKLKSGQWGPEIELHDAQAALTLLGKHHGLFIERNETTVDFLGDAATTLDRKLVPRDAASPAADSAGEPDDS